MRTFDHERLDTTYFRLRRLGPRPRLSALPPLIEFGTVELGWGCNTSGLRTNCFVIDKIETQLIRHTDRFHAIKENRTKLKVLQYFFKRHFYMLCNT